MKLHEAEQHARQELQAIYEDPEAAAIASLLMEELTGWNRSERLMNKAFVLDALQEETLEAHLKRLGAQEPVQYILKKAWFHGLPFYVDPGVLIPRPETEELADWILRDVKASGKPVFERRRNEADKTTSLKILDVGTGSGCLALVLKKNMPAAEVWGCDISESALNVARRNGSELDIRVDFQSADFLDQEQQKHLPTVDIVVSNPPYVPLQEKETMKANVVQYEPHTALFVADRDPLVFYQALARFGEHRLYPQGRIYAEIHEDAGAAVVALFTQAGYDVVLKKDMQGKERMIRATKIAEQ